MALVATYFFLWEQLMGNGNSPIEMRRSFLTIPRPQVDRYTQLKLDVVRLESTLQTLAYDDGLRAQTMAQLAALNAELVGLGTGEMKELEPLVDVEMVSTMVDRVEARIASLESELMVASSLHLTNEGELREQLDMLRRVQDAWAARLPMPGKDQPALVDDFLPMP